MELLVVIAIIILLLALLLPSMSRAREQARRVLCANHLRQWGTAIQAYREEFLDYLPHEGNASAHGVGLLGAWYNTLPQYVGAQDYKDIEGVSVSIKEFPNNDIWICPSKDLTDAYKSETGKNQIHYGMNQVLDGMGSFPYGSDDTPGFPDALEVARASNPNAPNPHVRATVYDRYPTTVFLFDIAPNSPSGSPRLVATESWRTWDGRSLGKFHGDFANILYLNGGVTNCKAADLYENRDNLRGKIRWEHPRLYWGFPRPKS